MREKEHIVGQGRVMFFSGVCKRENLDLRCRLRLAFVQCGPVPVGRGLRQGGPRTPAARNQIMGSLVNLVSFWSHRQFAVTWALE